MSSAYLPRLQTKVDRHPSQFYDLIEIFRIGGYAPHTNYLFLGAFLSALLNVAPSLACVEIHLPSFALKLGTLYT